MLARYMQRSSRVRYAIDPLSLDLRRIMDPRKDAFKRWLRSLEATFRGFLQNNLYAMPQDDREEENDIRRIVEPWTSAHQDDYLQGIAIRAMNDFEGMREGFPLDDPRIQAFMPYGEIAETGNEAARELLAKELGVHSSLMDTLMQQFTMPWSQGGGQFGRNAHLLKPTIHKALYGGDLDAIIALMTHISPAGGQRAHGSRYDPRSEAHALEQRRGRNYIALSDAMAENFEARDKLGRLYASPNEGVDYRPNEMLPEDYYAM